MDSRPSTSGPRGVLLVVALLFVPITVLRGGGGDGLTLVMQWGFLNTVSRDPNEAFHLYTLWQFFADQRGAFAALPGSIRAWPLAFGFHLAALASAAGGVALDREDRRVTGGLLLLAALATLWVAVGVASRLGVGVTAGWFAVLPVGGVATLCVALVVYGRDLRRAFTFE